jgi:hypothetical protein
MVPIDLNGIGACEFITAGPLAAGLTVKRIEIAKDGTIVIVSGLPDSQPERTELERWRARCARSS